MKTIKVVCGICIRNDKVLIAQRNYGSAKGYYEFPGGKVEKDETLEEALIREWKEECDMDISKVQFFSQSSDMQDHTLIDLYSLVCTSHQSPKLSVHSNFIWTTPDQIYKYNFFKADKELVKKLSGEWLCLKEQMK